MSLGSSSDMESTALKHLPPRLPCRRPALRHSHMLTTFVHVESRFFGHKRQRSVVLYVPVNLCDRRACSTRVAVRIVPGANQMFPVYEADSSNARCQRAGMGSSGPCLMKVL